MPSSTTPKAISRQIVKLGRRIVQDPQFEYVDVMPEEWCILSECFPNVTEKVNRAGGQILYGWQIWECPNLFVEAEFHAVWKSPEGRLIDITPKHHGQKLILFLHDSSRIYNGKRIDNERMPLRKDKLIEDYLYLSKEFVRVLEKNIDKDKPNMYTVKVEDIRPVVVGLKLTGEMLDAGQKENDKCFCGSGKKYKNCCSLT